MRSRSTFIALATFAFLLVAPLAASASRAPTEQELSELTAAAASKLNAGYYYNPSLSEVLISTRDESWAAAQINPTPPGHGDPMGGAFKHRASGWELVKSGDQCGNGTGIGMPTAVQDELELIPCPRAHPQHRHLQVICITKLPPPGQARGAYLIRPHSCNFHQRGKPVAYAWLLEMRQIHWLHWGTKVAVGVGKSLANMVGPTPTRVRLSTPETVCGHRVFTRAHFKFQDLGSSGDGLTLDNRLTSPSCP